MFPLKPAWILRREPISFQLARSLCCLQVNPSEIEGQFLQNYLKREVDFEVFWGDVQAYTQELNRMWRQ